jgi:hypothetical protein
MVIVIAQDHTNSFEIRGRLGKPNELGATFCGWSVLGDYSPLAGLYQRRPRKTGQIFVRMRDHIVPNPQTPAQQAWRAIFSSGVNAWQALTAEQKQVYNKKKWPRHMIGFSRFMREYLNTHK